MSQPGTNLTRGRGAVAGTSPVPWRARDGRFVLPFLAYLCAFYVFPLGCLIFWSLYDTGPTLKNFAVAGGHLYLHALWNTMTLSISVTVFTLVLGYPLAYALLIAKPMTRAMLMTAILLPFWTSILVRSFAWIIILGNNGLINKTLLSIGLISQPLRLIYNSIGVQIAMVHIMLPLIVLPLYAVFTRVDQSLIAAARSLGASPWRAFVRVFFPLSLPGVWSGSSLVLLLAAGFYITPALVGGREQINTATLIDMAVNELLNLGVGSALGVMLLVIVCGGYVAINTMSRTPILGENAS